MGDVINFDEKVIEKIEKKVLSLAESFDSILYELLEATVDDLSDIEIYYYNLHLSRILFTYFIQVHSNIIMQLDSKVDRNDCLIDIIRILKFVHSDIDERVF